MPKRTKTHRTGKAAVAQFMKLASEAWEVREKSGDYGVDLEFEVFSSDDSATGTVGYVQSKGTVSSDDEPNVSIRLDTLKYLTSFDVPSLIFCHSTSTGRSFWMWAQEAIWRAKPHSRTVNIRFREHHLWHEGTSGEIERSLHFKRLLYLRSNYMPFPIFGDEANSSLDPIVLHGLVTEIGRLLPSASQQSSGEKISLQISVRKESIQIRIERFLWRSITAKSEKTSDLICAAVYLLVRFWREFGFNNHAELAAVRCLRDRMLAPDRDTAAQAAMVLINRPKDAVELALMNKLHTTSDVAMSSFSVALYGSLGSLVEKTESIERFTTLAMAQSEDRCPNSALQYNLAKFYRTKHQFFRGVAAYNTLRKIDPTYLERTYFWYEIGGVLYQAGRYRMAAVAYKRLVLLEELTITQLLLGDVYLYSNDLSNAKLAYENTKDDLTSIGAEAHLKWEIIRWIESLSELNRPSPFGRGELLSFREISLQKGDTHTALWSHMALTFLDIDDIECWADAILLVLNTGNISLIRDVLRCAVSSHGLKPYIKFRADRAEFFDCLGELGGELDRMARDISDKTSAEKAYEPGVSIGEFEKLLGKGVLRVTEVMS